MNVVVIVIVIVVVVGMVGDVVVFLLAITTIITTNTILAIALWGTDSNDKFVRIDDRIVFPVWNKLGYLIDSKEQ